MMDCKLFLFCNSILRTVIYISYRSINQKQHNFYYNYSSGCWYTLLALQGINDTANVNYGQQITQN